MHFIDFYCGILWHRCVVWVQWMNDKAVLFISIQFIVRLWNLSIFLAIFYFNSRFYLFVSCPPAELQSVFVVLLMLAIAKICLKITPKKCFNLKISTRMSAICKKIDRKELLLRERPNFQKFGLCRGLVTYSASWSSQSTHEHYCRTDFFRTVS